MGLHRSITTNLPAEEVYSRIQTFWAIRDADILLSSVVGIPTLMRDENIDQEEISSSGSTTTSTETHHPNEDDLIEARISYQSLLKIMRSMIQQIYPPRKTRSSTGKTNTYTISYSSMTTIESQLEQWNDRLPLWLQRNDEIERKFLR